MAVIRLRWSIAVCVSAAFLLLTNPRIGKRVGNVISCFFLITRDNRHFIFIGIEIAIHCRTGGVTHGDSGFLRFVVVNFIHGVDVDVTGRHYAIAQANAATAGRKFDETLEIAMNLGVDPRMSDQIVRGMVPLPHGTGKTIRVCVFAKGEKADAAKADAAKARTDAAAAAVKTEGEAD